MMQTTGSAELTVVLCTPVFRDSQPVCTDCVCCRWKVQSRQRIVYHRCTHRQPLPQGQNPLCEEEFVVVSGESLFTFKLLHSEFTPCHRPIKLRPVMTVF